MSESPYSRRQRQLSPQELPEHLRGIREDVLKDHWFFDLSNSAPDADDYAKIIMLIARSDLDKDDRDKVLEYLESSHRSHRNVTERYDRLIDGIISWTLWAANWTRRLKGDEIKSPPETEVKP